MTNYEFKILVDEELARVQAMLDRDADKYGTANNPLYYLEDAATLSERAVHQVAWERVLIYMSNINKRVIAKRQIDSKLYTKLIAAVILSRAALESIHLAYSDVEPIQSKTGKSEPDEL